MKYIIYQITNMINGKRYIGAHKTNDLDDGYMGSGKYLNHAILKHGITNFKKEVLHVFDNPEEMYEKEAELVNEDFLSEQNTYNIRLGGSGGFEHINRTGKNGAAAAIAKRQELLENDPSLKVEWARKQQAGARRYSATVDAKERSRRGKQSNRTYLERNGKYSFTGKTHSDEIKKRISESSKVHQAGEKNSQYGTRWAWINKDGEIKKIRSELLSEYLDDNWNRGTKIR